MLVEQKSLKLATLAYVEQNPDVSNGYIIGGPCNESFCCPIGFDLEPVDRRWVGSLVSELWEGNELVWLTSASPRLSLNRLGTREPKSGCVDIEEIDLIEGSSVKHNIYVDEAFIDKFTCEGSRGGKKRRFQRGNGKSTYPRLKVKRVLEYVKGKMRGGRLGENGSTM